MSVDANFGINFGQEFQSSITDDDGVNHDYGDGLWSSYYPTTRIQADLDYLWSIPISRLRIAAGDLSSPMTGWRDDRAAAHLRTCELALIKGFHVEHGFVPKFGIKPNEWNFFLDNILSYAQQFQNLVSLHSGSAVLKIGNENEYVSNNGRDPITSMTRTSNVITVVMPTNHNLVTGWGIQYYNAATGNGSGSTLEVSSNSFKTVTVIDDYTFTFSSTGSDGTSSVGWIQWATANVRKQMKLLATSLKASGITLPLSYSCIQNLENNPNFYITNFVSLGRGDIDFIDLNIYGQWTDQLSRLQSFIDQVNQGYTGFGADHFRVTEWHDWHVNSGLPSDSENLKDYMLRRLQFIQSKPGLKHYLFNYRQKDALLTVADPYNSSTNLTHKDFWYSLIGKRSPTKQIVNSTTAGTPIFNLRSDAMVHTRRSTLLEFNYGQDTQDGSYETDIVEADFERMWNLGCRKLRIAMSNHVFTAGVDASKTLAIAALARGFHVIWGVSYASFSTLTDAAWPDYVAAVLDAAAWAESNSISEFCIGNEIEFAETVSGVLTSSVSKIKALATEVQAVFSGTVTYAMSQSSMEYAGAPGGWLASGKGDIDTLGYNVYADNGLTVAQGKSQFETRTAALYAEFGASLYISEWNIGTGTLFPSETAEQNEILLDRLNFLIGLGITTTYFYTFRWDNGSTNEKLYFPLIQGLAYKEWLGVLFPVVGIT